mmetsp:Transcript_70648/g.117331  ORF Transcript_70648/g.117331 Transcript_70648/m.117331 type:complete len:343 (-) Transcript_70648:471-1499(-)
MARSMLDLQMGQLANVPLHCWQTHAWPQATSTHSRGAARHTTHSSTDPIGAGASLLCVSGRALLAGTFAAVHESSARFVRTRCRWHSRSAASNARCTAAGAHSESEGMRSGTPVCGAASSAAISHCNTSMAVRSIATRSTVLAGRPRVSDCGPMSGHLCSSASQRSVASELVAAAQCTGSCVASCVPTCTQGLRRLMLPMPFRKAAFTASAPPCSNAARSAVAFSWQKRQTWTLFSRLATNVGGSAAAGQLTRQSLHTVIPQLRQWCLQRVSPKAREHRIHAAAPAQAGGTDASISAIASSSELNGPSLNASTVGELFLLATCTNHSPLAVRSRVCSVRVRG